MRQVLAGCTLAVLLFLSSHHQIKSSSQQFEEGYITTADGVRLHYVKGGSQAKTIILPARLFAFEDFRWLADRHTLIAYDMRNRGRSDFVQEGSRITIHDDVRDLETIRKHFGVEKFSTIGYSYLGLMVVLYAMEHPDRIERIIQVGPVPLRFATKYPEHLTAGDDDSVADPEGLKRLRKLREDDFHHTHPQEYCEQEWQVMRFRLVGNPAKVGKLRNSVCDMPNEWPTNLGRHLANHFVSVQKLDIPKDKVAQVKAPVLVIHGTRDRNAPYGAGREWALLLPNARLFTVKGAAHQVFAEFEEIVMPAVRTFLEGSWPAGVERVTTLDPHTRSQ